MNFVLSSILILFKDCINRLFILIAKFWGLLTSLYSLAYKTQGLNDDFLIPICQMLPFPLYLEAVMWHSSSHLDVNNSAHERFCLCCWFLIRNRWVKKLITLHPPTTACLQMRPAAIQTWNKNKKQKPTPWRGPGLADTSEPTLERLTLYFSLGNSKYPHDVNHY